MPKRNAVSVNAKSIDGEFLVLRTWGHSNLAEAIAKLSPEDSVTFTGEYAVIA